MISVLILTKNEELDLPGCLGSVAWCDDVHVLDSGSTDATCDLARSLGANVTVKSYPDSDKPFGGDESAHRNWSLQNIPFKYPWLLLLDADERVTPELTASMRQAVKASDDFVAFRVQRRDFFLDTWLKHVQASALYLRLFRPSKMSFMRLINPVPVADGPIGQIEGYLDHFPFSKGLTYWVQRHNSYSSLEAKQIINNRVDRPKISLRAAIFSADFHQRRFNQKELFYRVPFRPLAKFLFLYIGRRGFLDGRAGLAYAVLTAFYEYLIVMKVRELELQCFENTKANHQNRV